MLLIRIWILDDDTGKKKLGSRWFKYDDLDERKDLDAFFEKFSGRRFYEETRYVKEKK